MTWEQTKDRFLESDVVKWKEAIWSSRRTRKKTRPWGAQEITGQIVKQDGEYTHIIVLKSAIVENNIGTDLMPHKVGTTLIKKHATILRGNPERLHWSEEDVRAALMAQLR
ncbi:MAG: hypothetical protein PW788_06720 [Micavibrio sp.]|nr:hypothetical protein [Micavibrio sp.]